MLSTDSTLKVFATIGLGLFAGSLFVVFGVSIYRLWFHPLANYPGPFFARTTDLYAAYHAWKGDLHLDMWRCHEKHGEYIRYGPDRLIFNTATAMRDIYSFGKNVQKCKGYLAMMHRVSNTITQRNKSLHAKQRRLLSYGFSEAALRTYEEAVAAHVQTFCCHLVDGEGPLLEPRPAIAKEKWSSPKDMARWCDYIAFDVMLDVVYGSKSEMITKPDNRPLLDDIARSNIRVGVMMPLYYLKNTAIDRYLFPASIVSRYRFLAFVKALLQSKKDTKMLEPQRQSVYSILMGSNDGEGLGHNEIAAESTNLIVAGSDTTSTVLAAFFFYLARNSAVYAHANAEIRSCFNSASDLYDRKKLASCTYLRACIDESMRMAPPIASALFREVEPGGALVDGKFLPTGCDIGTCIYSIHHNPAYYPNPFVFSPERWLMHEDGSNKETVALAQSAFTPFSIGPRSCIGKSLALMELTSVLAHVLYQFDFRTAEGKEGTLGEGRLGAERGRHRVEEFQLYDHLTAAKKGPLVQFRARNI